MAMSWTGKLVVIRGDDGKDHIGITHPTGVIDALRVTVYDCTGSYPPTGFPGRVAVDDTAAWLKQHRQAGITFALVGYKPGAEPGAAPDRRGMPAFPDV